MRALEVLDSWSALSWSAVYLLNSLWQLPLIFAAAWIAARLARPVGPRWEHRVWVAALFAEIVVPACNLDLNTLWLRASALLDWSFGCGAAHGATHVILGPGTAFAAGLRLPAPMLAAILLAYACSLFYFAGRLAWGLFRTNRMLRKAVPLPRHNNLSRRIERCEIPAALHPVYLAISPSISGPVTIGIRQRALLLPPGFLESVGEVDLEAVLAHEFAHMRRHDFAKNLLYGFLSLPVAYHPLLWLSCVRLAETREMVCDEMAAVAGRDRYARSLLRLASLLTQPIPAKTLHAIGIFDANIFERRIMNLAQKRREIRTGRRFAIVAACLLLTIATCASALALRMDVAPTTVPTENPKKIHVKADSMKLITNVVPVYPQKAKDARLEGSVVLDVIVGKDGVPEHISIQKGPRDLQASALDAVRQWRWQPYLLNGDPIKVETVVTVVFTLDKK